MDTLPSARVTICRKVSFSSAHRYYRADLSEDENRELYGTHYSPHGHGHNFVLEAYLEGPVDPRSGMVVNLKDLDGVLKEITAPLDHHHLNFDVPYFQSRVPTTENVAAFCLQELLKHYTEGPIRVRRVRLFEGPDLWVDLEPTGGSRSEFPREAR